MRDDDEDDLPRTPLKKRHGLLTAPTSLKVVFGIARFIGTINADVKELEVSGSFISVLPPAPEAKAGCTLFLDTLFL